MGSNGRSCRMYGWLRGSTAAPDRRTCREIISEAAVKAAEHRVAAVALTVC